MRRVCATAGECPGLSGAQPGKEVDQELFASPNPPLDKGSGVDRDEDERFDDAQPDFPYLQPVNLMCRGLSPLIEVSSELASAESTESLRNCADLETELNAALSRLSDMTCELEEAEEAVIESHQTKVTETVTLQRAPEADSVSASAETTGYSFEGLWSNPILGQSSLMG